MSRPRGGPGGPCAGKGAPERRRLSGGRRPPTPKGGFAPAGAAAWRGGGAQIKGSALGPPFGRFCSGRRRLRHLAGPAADNGGEEGTGAGWGVRGPRCSGPLPGEGLTPAQPSPVSPRAAVPLAEGCSWPGIQPGNRLSALREPSRSCNPTGSPAGGQGLLGKSSLAAQCLPQRDAGAPAQPAQPAVLVPAPREAVCPNETRVN